MISVVFVSDLSDLLKELSKAEYRAVLESTLWYSVLIETLCRAHQQYSYALTVQQIHMVCSLFVYLSVLMNLSPMVYLSVLMNLSPMVSFSA